MATINDSEDPDKAAGLGGQIEAFVRKFMITPEQANNFVAAKERKYRNRKGSNGVPSGDPLTEEDKLAIARAIISRYATHTMWVGAGTAAPGVIPGWGTAVAVGGGVADVGVTMKLQADMVLCLVELFEETLSPEEEQDLAIPGGIGVAIAGGSNYALTQIVGKVALKVLLGPKPA